MEHVAATTQDGIQADVRAAVEYLRSAEGGSARSVFTVGFCFGGRNSWLAAASGHGLAGAVGFYGMPGSGTARPGRSSARPSSRLRSSRSRPAPTATSTAEMNAAFDEALAAAGVEHALVTYDGAPHSFFDRRYEEHAEASEDAWRRVLEFVSRNAKSR